MLDKMQVREDDEDFRNEIDDLFDDLAQRKPGHFAVRQYQKYKMASGKTAKSILVSCGARLAVFDIEELREITSYDELSLDTIGDKRTALFLIMSDTDASFNFLISLAYAVLVQNISVDSDVSTALWTCIGYTVLLCFTLFKSSSVAKSIFNAH